MRPRARESASDLPQEVVAAARRAPLYRARAGKASGRALSSWPVHDHEDLADAPDAFGGRLDPASSPATITQACHDQQTYWGLGTEELDRIAGVLAGCWTALGLDAGDRVAIHDFGSSPVTLYASRYFHPHLSSGAAELTGCVPICNDGLAELAPRAVHLITYARPAAVFVAAHAVDPLRRALGAEPTSAQVDTAEASSERVSGAGARSRGVTDPQPTMIVTADEAPWTAESLERLVSARVPQATQLLRADLALLLAPPCRDDATAFHVDPDVYAVEILDDVAGSIVDEPGRSGRLVVTNRAIVSCPVVRYATDIVAELAPSTCACATSASTVRLAA